MSAPRQVGAAGRSDLEKQLKSFGVFRFDISEPKNLEPGSLLDGLLAEGLLDAGWRIQSYDGDLPKKPLPRNLAVFIIPRRGHADQIIRPENGVEFNVGITTGLYGVTFEYDDVNSKAQGAVHAIEKTLRECCGIWSTDEPQDRGSTFEKPGPSSDLIHVVIGAKPP